MPEAAKEAGTESNLQMQQFQAEYRKLPAVDALLHQPQVLLLAGEYGETQVIAAVRAVVAAARAAIAAGEPAPMPAAWPGLIQLHLAAADLPSLRPVINATGVIVHTNLGRAPLSEAALGAVGAVAAGYSNLEYELGPGTRGSRHDHARRLLCELTGAEDALVVNNNAAAVYLVLAALCQGREVLISRGQLVEIGGGFRIPDVLRQSGARLVEVGTTNRTKLRDYEAALTPATRLLMRVHPSNYRVVGFTAMPELGAVAELAHRHGLLLYEDAGSGALTDLRPLGLDGEPVIADSLAAGADVVTFSGDKLLGGVQAGCIVGRREVLARIRKHPLFRALRAGKMVLAALEATLEIYRRGTARADIPVIRMMAATEAELSARAGAFLARLRAASVNSDLQCEISAGRSAIGGGSAPLTQPLTALLLLTHKKLSASELEQALRAAAPPVIARVAENRVLLDLRTVAPAEEQDLLATLARLS